MEEKTSRDYKCGVCGLPKKGHKCQGAPSSSWEESFTVAPQTQTPARARSSKSRPIIKSGKSPKYITPAPESDDFTFQDVVPVVAKSLRRARPCGECQNCLRPECQQCENCLDMKRFGGPGIKRQRCLERKCLNKQYHSIHTTNQDNKFHFTSSSSSSIMPTSSRSRSGTKRKSAIAANVTIMTALADDEYEEDSDNDVPLGEFFDDNCLPESHQLLAKRARFASSDEDCLPSFEEMSVSDYGELVDLLDLPQISSPSEGSVDWQDLHLADLSPIPIVPTRVVKLDTSLPFILGPTNSAQNLVVTGEVTSPSRPGVPVPKTFVNKPSLRTIPLLAPEASPSFGASVLSLSLGSSPHHPQYSPIKLLPRKKECEE